jgi:type I restriction enzyme M protein
LLERNADEVKSGADRYFTPRPLIEAITQLVDPEPGETGHDPAVGAGGFLLATYDHMKAKPGAQDRTAWSRGREGEPVVLRSRPARQRYRDARSVGV